MLTIHNHAAPNVVPGTNFNTQRFEELYAWINSLSADSVRAAFQPNQYGLIKPLTHPDALKLLQIENKLVLKRCCGITPNGYLIGIFEEVTPILSLNIQSFNLDPNEAYYVLIEVDNEQRQPFGKESIDLPARPMFSMPYCRLHIQSTEQSLCKKASAFPIGKLEFNQGKWELAEFLPPCVNIDAHPVTRMKYLEYQEYLNVLINEQPRIIRQTDSFRDKAMIELREFTMQLGSFLATKQSELQFLTEQGNPSHLIKFWASFAKLASFLLKCLTDRPGFFNLLYQNTRGVNGVFFTPESMNAAITQTAELIYDHNNSLKAFQIVDHFLQLIVPVIKALAIGTLRPLEGQDGGWEQSAMPKQESRDKFLTW